MRWNAAIALARHNQRDGVPVLGQMLDRQYVAQVVTRGGSAESGDDPVSDVMISGLRAIAALKDDSLKSLIAGLSQNDSSLKVRQAALEALKVLG